MSQQGLVLVFTNNFGQFTLQIFGGTLTEITCSAAMAGYRLVHQQIEYDTDHEDYNQLPDLFDIEARVSPNRQTTTLFINGTNCSNNVTIMWRDFNDITIGRIVTLFYDDA